MRIRSAVHEILADKAFTATNGLISQSFVVAFVYSTYMWIALIWGFPGKFHYLISIEFYSLLALVSFSLLFISFVFFSFIDFSFSFYVSLFSFIMLSYLSCI